MQASRMQNPKRGTKRSRNGQPIRNGGRKGDNQMISHPPQIPSYGITRDVRLRFVAVAATVLNITFQNLLDTILVATGATSTVDLFNAVRINSVELWAIAALGTPATVILSYAGATVGAAGDQKTHTDTSMGVEPAHVKARPDPLTQAGQFQASAANNAFFLDVAAGTIIDVSMTLRQPVEGIAVASQNVAVGATAGAVYYRGLDGKTTALTNFPIQGAFAVI
jgi:hypothetical protein